MSVFLARIGQILADADQASPPSHAWDELLPELARRTTGGAPFAAGLWIADDATGRTHTLWRLLTEEGPVRRPPCGVTFSADSPDQAALRSACLSIRSRWASIPNLSHCVALPLAFTDKNREKSETSHLGLISVLSEYPAHEDAELQIAIKMATAWLRVNRQVRVMHALADLQDRRRPVSTVPNLATMLCGVLADHANARKSCAVYIPSGSRLVRADAHREGRSGDAPREFSAQSAISAWHFARDSSGNDFQSALLSFAPDGLRRDASTVLPNIMLRDLIGCDSSEQPVTTLLCRIRDRRVDSAVPAPIALLVMACEPHVKNDYPSIGGTFTETHRQTLAHALDYFCNSYALLLQRERMRVIREGVETIASRAVDVMNEADDFAHLHDFAKLAVQAVPAVIDAVVIDQRASSAAQRSYYHTPSIDAGKEPNSIPPAWLPNIDTNWRGYQSREIRLAEGHCMLIPVGKPNNPQHQVLALRTRAHQLSIVEHHLVEQIAAECRAEFSRHLHKPQWELQLAEVRHNLRSVIHSVLGKALRVSELYRVVSDMSIPAAEIKERLINRAQYRKAINQLNYAADQLWTLTENIRTLVGAGARIDLQLTSINLPEEVRSIHGMFREEIERRRLQFNLDVQDEKTLDHISADRQWIHVLLFNLIENAVKYSRREGGSIDLRLWAQGQFWKLEVTNEGKYIPADDRARIFQPFYRVPAERGEQTMPGTGLGLSSVWRIVELHKMAGLRPPGGHWIQVDSQLIDSQSSRERGAARNIFRVAIPLHVRGAA